MRGGESRRRVPYGMRSDEQPSAWVETEETRATSRRVLVAFEDDRGRMARYFRSLGWTVDVGQAKEGSDDGACGAQAVVQAPHYLPDLGHLAFSLTGVFRG
jgi:hypothetical protein